MIRLKRGAVAFRNPIAPLLLLSAVFPTWSSPVLSTATVTGEPSRFAMVNRHVDESSAWISLDGIRLVYGSDRRVVLARAGHGVVESRIMLDTVATGGVLFGDRLYFGEAEGRLAVVELDDPHFGSHPLNIGFRPEGTLGLGRMDEHLLVLEDGAGLRILELPPPATHHMGEGPLHAEDVRLIAMLEIPLNFAAVAGSARTIFIATEEGDLIVVDARKVDEPRLVRTVSLGITIDALAANGGRVYALHAGGLIVLDLTEGMDEVVEGLYPDIHGRGIVVAGRGIHVASEGVVAYVDRAIAGAVHPVTVSSNVFTPSSLSIAAGDTVEWTNVGGFHNVESCDGVSDPAQCSGVATAGLFRSGNPSGPPWTFSFTFDNAGANPYFCAQHVAFGMTGSVTVTAPVVPPPGTPDGSGTTVPVTVAKAPFGLFQNRLEVTWDVATCTEAQDYQLLFGDGGDLPESFVGTYVPSGAVCSIGTGGIFAWNTPPDPLPGEFAWFLVVANGDSNEEGAWGRNSGNIERAGPGAGGASVVCNADKNLSNGCGQ